MCALPIKWFRKLPVEIATMRYTVDTHDDVITWLSNHGVEVSLADDAKLVIPTLEGPHFASLGDYIIRGIQNEFYPCKPDIFEQTYEAVERLDSQ